jgi:hypothetical protein
MSKVRLVIREADRDWSGTVHGSAAECAVAALGADPVTFAELEVACGRFAKPAPNFPVFAQLSPGLWDEPYDAGAVVIDLIARLVVADSAYSSPGVTGTVCYHDGQCATNTWLPYRLADDWLMTSDRGKWLAVAETRRRERAVRPLRDVRKVFYGRPLLEFVARETLAAFARPATTDASGPQENPGDPRCRTDEEITYDTLKQIHAAWMLTPREDLGGVCPRDVALERRDHLTWDLQHQSEHWSLLGECPPGLEDSSFAFRYGGFGTHELVEYYGLVREQLWSCWQRLEELEKTPAAADGAGMLSVGAFLTSELPRLERARDDWMETPDPELHGRTPRSVIDRERARLPEGGSGHDAVIDEDCPCCQMLADMPGPMFWHLDGSGMDDDFAFDLRCRTREEWEAEQRSWEEHCQRFNAEQAERRRLGLSGPGFAAAGGPSDGSSSVVEAHASDVPLGARLFGTAARLAELIVAIRIAGDGPSAPTEPQRLIDQLNRDFGNLRDILQTTEPSLAEALLQPGIDRFAESLADVATACRGLSVKCESLTNELSTLLDPNPTEPFSDSSDLDDLFWDN